MKEKVKTYGDRKRNAKVNEIKEGDNVLLKRQIRSNKLATVFDPQVYVVIKRVGAKLTVENVDTKVQYRRSVAHTKKVIDQTIRRRNTWHQWEQAISITNIDNPWEASTKDAHPFCAISLARL